MGIKKFHKDYENSTSPLFQISAGQLGSPTSPMTAKQLTEFSSRLNEGVKNIEVGTLDPKTFETIPKEHFDTIRQLAKMSGANVSMHAPMIDPTGFHENQWSEELRRENEQHLVSIMERAHQMSPNGNIPVVLHGGNSFSQEYDKELNNKIPVVVEHFNEKRGAMELKELKDKEGKTIYQEGIRKMGVIDQSTGKLAPVEYEKKEYPDGIRIMDPWKRIRNLNETQWDEEKMKVFSLYEDAAKVRERMDKKIEMNKNIANAGFTEKDPQYFQTFKDNTREVELLNTHLENIDQRIASNYIELHDKIQRFKPKKTDPSFKAYSISLKNYDKNVEKINKNSQEKMAMLRKGLENMKKASEEEKTAFIIKQRNEIERIKGQEMMVAISRMMTPRIWKSVTDLTIEKTAKTVSRAMYKLHENNPEIPLDKLPVLAIENFQPMTALSTAKDLKEAISESRKLFVEKIKKEVGSKKKAEKIANKLIGATWDVGHINQLRKAGYSEKELKKKVISETKKIAKDVRHLHLTDNFGFHDSHLAPGMGNVPFKEILQELEKEGYFNDPNRRAIVEAGAFVKEFEMSPTNLVFDYFQSPLYRMSDSGPYWGKERVTPYYDGHVQFPQEHFNLYGSSFTTLPQTFGGQVGENKSRFSKTPMA